MLEDTNVTRAIERRTEPLQKQIAMLQIKVAALRESSPESLISIAEVIKALSDLLRTYHDGMGGMPADLSDEVDNALHTLVGMIGRTETASLMP